jgi:hypothetical protein
MQYSSCQNVIAASLLHERSRVNAFDHCCIVVAIAFVFTGATHFTGMKHDYAAMLPGPLSGNLGIIYLSGILEIAGSVGLLVPRTRRLAGVCLALYLVAVFPVTCTLRSTRSRFVGSHPPRCGCGRRYSSSSSGWSRGLRSGNLSIGSKRPALRSPLQRERFRRSVS